MRMSRNSCKENGKKVRRSPRGVRVDIYTEDVSGIDVSIVSKTAQTKVLKRVTSIRIMCLEALLLAKLRASRPSRPQDPQDMQELLSYRRKEIDRKVFEELGAKETEIAQLRQIALFQR